MGPFYKNRETCTPDSPIERTWLGDLVAIVAKLLVLALPSKLAIIGVVKVEEPIMVSPQVVEIAEEEGPIVAC